MNKLFKIYVFICLFSTLHSYYAFAQDDKFEFGYSAGATLTYVPGGFFINGIPASSPTFGLFSRVNPYGDLKFGIGAEYQPIIFAYAEPLDKEKKRFDMIRFPVWVHLNINVPPDPKVKCDFILGYSYSRIVKTKTLINPEYLDRLTKYVNSGFFGLEFDIHRPEKKNIMFATLIDIINIDSWAYGTALNFKILYRRSL